MNETLIGYQEDPVNGDGIIRARTTSTLRTYEFSRDLRTLDVINREFNQTPFPGIYILTQGNKCYVGESSNVFSRLTQHFNVPPNEQVRNFDKVLVVSDGRVANQSVLNDQVIRKVLEHYMNILLSANHMSVTSLGTPQELNPFQKNVSRQLIDEVNLLLDKRGWITRLLPSAEVREVKLDQLPRILREHGYRVESDRLIRKNKALLLNGVPSFYRPGSLKSSGWQITFRDVFLDYLKRGVGNLLINRDGIILMPMTEVQRAIPDLQTAPKVTYDIFVTFEEGRVYLNYQGQTLDVTEHRLMSSTS